MSSEFETKAEKNFHFRLPENENTKAIQTCQLSPIVVMNLEYLVEILFYSLH